MIATAKSRIRRHGLSLLEVILAITILGGALIMIGQLIRIGARSAERAKMTSHAQILCDTKLAEISAGALPLESTSGTQVEESPEWYYSVQVSNADQVGLLKVIVTVSENDEGAVLGGNSFTLTRLLPDPDYDPYTPEEQ